MRDAKVLKPAYLVSKFMVYVTLLVTYWVFTMANNTLPKVADWCERICNGQ